MMARTGPTLRRALLPVLALVAATAVGGCVMYPYGAHDAGYHDGNGHHDDSHHDDQQRADGGEQH
ncbi:MAG TPA: hypothetical protein VNE67_09680 [Acetobacteraceae bacterium]|nr:hypothetical protein [Acetobacteraceae bacterium]